MTTPQHLSLEDRIKSVLIANGFVEYEGGDPHTGKFVITGGVGATVGIAWMDATEADRADLLAKYENRLRNNGLRVENRRSYLYVYEPAGPTATLTSTPATRQGDPAED